MTNAELAILSLIAECPRHGYEIEQVIEARGMREWTEIGFSSIYYLLKKLKKSGLIRGESERQSGQGPARVVYNITSVGRDALRKGILEALSVPGRCYPPLQLGLANLPSISRKQAVEALRHHRDALKERIRFVHTRWEDQRPLPYFVEAMFSQSTAMLEAEHDWIESFIIQLETANVQN
jgi:DNA-binding PadR family transcriptional regulator